jgi:hypothetical protein
VMSHLGGQSDPCPVFVALALGPWASGESLPGALGKLAARVSRRIEPAAVGTRRSQPMASTVAHLASLQLGAQPRAGAIDFVGGHPPPVIGHHTNDGTLDSSAPVSGAALWPAQTQ